MSDTPETDAAIKEQSEWKLPFVSTTMDGVTYDGAAASLCRRMERERDKAQYKLEDARQSLEVALGDLSEAKRERDEARAGRQAYKQLAVKHAQDRDEARAELHDIRLNLGDNAEGYTLLHAVCALQNERDELLERNAKLRDIADRALMLNQSQ